MITFKEVKVLDLNTEALGIPTSTLMENAGKALSREVQNILTSGKKVLFLCGTGNNGGDGLVAARYLSEIHEVEVVILGKEMRTEISRKNHERLPETVDVSTLSTEDEDWERSINDMITKADIIIDSMLGVGISGKLREPYHSTVQQINTSGKPVFSVDVPTGFGGEISVNPSSTVTFHDLKPGMIEERMDDQGNIIQQGNCGKIIVADIGIPVDAEKFVGVGEFVYYPLPSHDAHKGNHGNVLIVGGGPFTGAPALAACAALRTGSDLVFLAVPSSVHPIIASYSKDLIVHPLPSPEHLSPKDVQAILPLVRRAHVVLIGPGLGKHPETTNAVQELARKLDKPLVIDADAIYALKDMEFHGNVIFTPHKMEFSDSYRDSTLKRIDPGQEVSHHRIFSKLSEEERERVLPVLSFSKTHGAIVVQKGHHDLISDGERFKFNRTGNPGMTVGGTGDVLSGIIASLYARGLEPFDAARLGAFINGRAGDLAYHDHWYSLTASDVIQKIPGVFMQVFEKTL